MSEIKKQKDSSPGTITNNKTLTYDEWAKKLEAPTWIVAGAARQNDWAPNQQLTKSEFEKGCQGFTKSPMSKKAGDKK